MACRSRTARRSARRARAVVCLAAVTVLVGCSSAGAGSGPVLTSSGPATPQGSTGSPSTNPSPPSTPGHPATGSTTVGAGTGSSGTGPPSGATVTGIDIADTASAAAFDGDGDLWPNCWGADGNIYTAHGDGKGFGGTFTDIGADVIHGSTGNLSGRTTAIGDQVGQVWSGDGFTRKPTGIACVGDTLYLAVQDLATDFNSAPAATIATSTDHGRTWTWDTSAPMFAEGTFTTIFFLDYGRGYSESPGGYVYAYGLDHNWRDSYTDAVPDPVNLYLARVPKGKVADRSAWQFYTGGAGSGPTWSATIDNRTPVLHDPRRVARHPTSGTLKDLSVLSQGGVVYDAPLRTYLYTSWTEYTYEVYSAPQPWGPWKPLGSKDFGPYPWTDAGYGGYATTIPSKFISADGLNMWMQSNVCPCASAGISVYYFSLRKVGLQITPGTEGGR